MANFSFSEEKLSGPRKSFELKDLQPSASYEVEILIEPFFDGEKKVQRTQQTEKTKVNFTLGKKMRLLPSTPSIQIRRKINVIDRVPPLFESCKHIPALAVQLRRRVNFKYHEIIAFFRKMRSPGLEPAIPCMASRCSTIRLP